jgi:hypothetical protein
VDGNTILNRESTSDTLFVVVYPLAVDAFGHVEGRSRRIPILFEEDGLAVAALENVDRYLPFFRTPRDVLGTTVGTFGRQLSSGVSTR